MSVLDEVPAPYAVQADRRQRLTRSAAHGRSPASAARRPSDPVGSRSRSPGPCRRCRRSCRASTACSPASYWAVARRPAVTSANDVSPVQPPAVRPSLLNEPRPAALTAQPAQVVLGVNGRVAGVLGDHASSVGVSAPPARRAFAHRAAQGPLPPRMPPVTSLAETRQLLGVAHGRRGCGARRQRGRAARRPARAGPARRTPRPRWPGCTSRGSPARTASAWRRCWARRWPRLELARHGHADGTAAHVHRARRPARPPRLSDPHGELLRSLGRFP